jgi:hypothetical protein
LRRTGPAGEADLRFSVQQPISPLKEHLMQANQHDSKGATTSTRAAATSAIVGAALLAAAVLTGMHRQANAGHALPAMAAASADRVAAVYVTIPVTRPFDSTSRVLPDELPPGY